MWAAHRASGLANVAFGVLIALSAVIHLVADDPVVAAWPGFVGAVFGIFGVTSVHSEIADRFKGWSAVAGIAAVTGLALSVGQLYGLTFEPPGAGPLGQFFPLGYGPLLFGSVLLAVLLLMSSRATRLAAAALIAGPLLNAAGFATPEVRLAGVIIFGAGIAWIGAMVAARPHVGQQNDERTRVVIPEPTSPRHGSGSGVLA